MTHATPIVLLVLGDPELSAAADRVVAAVGARAARVVTPSRRGWLGADAIVLDEPGALRCVREGLPRRDGVLLVGSQAPSAQTWTAAVDVGAQHVCVLPSQDTELMRHLGDAVEAGSSERGGRVIGVTAGRGGGGASVLSAALALSAGEALLIDVDHCGGGLDLLLGGESLPGLRWPDVRVHGGRLSWTAVRDVLPRRDGVSMLSATRSFHEIDPGAVAAVADAGRRGGVTVICDIPRQLSPAAECALQHADLVVVVTTCDVRGVAATTATVTALASVNPALGLVVRGPSPGGLRAREVAAAAGVPLLAAMRPEPLLAQRLEQGGMRLRPRSPLNLAARRVLDALQRIDAGRAA
nr:septum site-determining protein Ssd [Mycolicibacterium sp.]